MKAMLILWLSLHPAPVAFDCTGHNIAMHFDCPLSFPLDPDLKEDLVDQEVEIGEAVDKT